MIADFGLSMSYFKPEEYHYSDVITLPYRPPELIITSEEKYDLRADLWSMSCVIAEMYLGIPVFGKYGYTTTGVLRSIFEITGGYSSYPHKPLSKKYERIFDNFTKDDLYKKSKIQTGKRNMERFYLIVEEITPVTDIFIRYVFDRVFLLFQSDRAHIEEIMERF